MKPVSVAVIGCGAVAEHYYAPVLEKLAHKNCIAVTAIFDPAKDRQEKLKKVFPAVHVLTEISQMQALNIDLAVIASPVGRHAEQSIEALKLGCAVLCEKPMAQTIAQCQAMIDVATHMKKSLFVGHFRRQYPAARTIKQILERQLLGNARTFTFNEGGPFQWPAAGKSLFNKQEAGGGILMDLGVHMLDLALWWFGDVGQLEYADDAMGGVEANCQLQLKFRNGVAGIARLSRDWWLDNTCTINCDNGSISWKITQATKIDVDTSESARKIIDDLLDPVQSNDEPDHLRAFFHQLELVVESVRNNSISKDLVSGVEALKSLEIIEACYAQGTLMAMPWLSDAEILRALSLRQTEVNCK